MRSSKPLVLCGLGFLISCAMASAQTAAPALTPAATTPAASTATPASSAKIAHHSLGPKQTVEPLPKKPKPPKPPKHQAVVKKEPADK